MPGPAMTDSAQLAPLADPSAPGAAAPAAVAVAPVTPPELGPALRWRTILILGALTTVTPLTIDLYLPAFHAIAGDLHCTMAQVTLSVSSYFIGMAMGQLFYGPLLDRFGRRAPMYIGLGLYVLATVACIAAPTVGWLIGFRYLEALGGCSAGVAAMSMVRDFFPVRETAKILSLLMLILGVSPLLAPTVGGLIATTFGWHAVFYALIAMVVVVLLAVRFVLPVGYVPDPKVVLRPGPIARVYLDILRDRQFVTYTLASACSFSGLFIYVAGSSVIFMDTFHTSPHVYGAIFAVIAAGFIGSNQVNIMVSRHVPGERIFATAIVVQIVTGTIFTIGTYLGWFGLGATVVLLFCLLSCCGFTNPNGTALALGRVRTNIGSAAALLGFLQMGIGATASSMVGMLNVNSVAPIIAVETTMAVIGFAILILGVGWRRDQAPLPTPDAPAPGMVGH